MAAGQAGPVQGDPQGYQSPVDDPEIAALIAEVRDEARKIGVHRDLASLNRKLARLSLVVTINAPDQTWASLEERAAALARATLWMRRVEADLPPPGVDQAQLRREAAAQMMKELKSVLSAEDQAELARLVKLGADRLIAWAGRGSATTDGQQTRGLT